MILTQKGSASRTALVAALAAMLAVSGCGVFKGGHQFDIIGRVLRADFFNVAGRQGLAITRCQLVAALFAVPCNQFLAQVIGPVAHDLCDAHIQLVRVPLATRSPFRSHDGVDPRQRRLIQQHG